MEISPENLDVFVKLIIDAIQQKNGWLVGTLGLIGTVYVLRKFVLVKVPFFATQAGGAIINLVMAFLGVAAAALIGGAPVTGALVLDALQKAFLAAGGWTLVKHLLGALTGGKSAEQIKGEAVAAGAAEAAKVPDAEIKDIKDLVNK